VTACYGLREEGCVGVWNINNFKKVKTFNENSTGAMQVIWDSINKLLFSCHQNKNIE
jgi:hypothetical protein